MKARLGPARPEDGAPAFRLLLACCRHPLTGDDLAHLEACLALPVDWEAFLALAARHRIQPQVLASLSRLSGRVPGPVLASLEHTVGGLTRHTLALAAELVRLLGHFREAGLPLVVLKGPPLSLELFGDLALRHSKDLDLLVPAGALASADGLLRALGYRRLGGPLSPRQLRRLRRVAAHLAYAHADGTLVELHLRPFHPDGIMPAREIRAWFSGARPGPLGASVLPPASRLAYLCAHGSLHRWFRLKWLCDLEASLKAGDLEPEAWARQVRDLGLERMAAEGLRLVRACFGTALPPALAALADGTPLPRGFLEASRAALEDPREPAQCPWSVSERLAFVRHYAQLRRGPALKARLLHELLVTEEPIRAVDLPVGLYPLYYVLRPLLWLRRRGALGGRA